MLCLTMLPIVEKCASANTWQNEGYKPCQKWQADIFDHKKTAITTYGGF